MDVSLDDYIVTKSIQAPGAKQGIQSRLGNFKQATRNIPKPQFHVTGLGKLQGNPTNVRQRLGGTQAVVTDAREKLSGGKAKFADAREKLLQKSKFVDARVRIQNKQGKGAAATVTKTIKPITWNNTGDARQNIIRKQQPKAQQSIAAPRVTIGQFGRIATVSSTPVAQAQGHLLKTVNNDMAGTVQIQNTIENEVDESYAEFIRQRQQQKAFNPSITIQNSFDIEEEDPSYNLPVSSISSLQGPTIRIQNERYAAPVPKPAARPVRLTPPASIRAKPIPVITSQKQVDAMTEAFRMVPSRQRAAPSPQPPVMMEEEMDTTPVPVEDVVSPLQGYRLLITNLHPVVTQDDIIELFGSVGALKKARLARQGLGEVVFVHREDAVAAVKKYHNRELDGMPMQVRLANTGTGIPTSARLAPAKPPVQPRVAPLPRPAPPPPPPQEASPDDELLAESAPIPQPLKLGKGSKSEGTGINMEMSVVHKALFKTKTEGDPAKPVTFTVKI